MNSDIDLLKLAATAARYTDINFNNAYPTRVIGRDEDWDVMLSVYWNPLEDDGDALRLAVDLSITVQYSNNSPPELGTPRECAFAVLENKKWFSEAPIKGEKNAAMRRAIVRAAAACAEHKND